jgi:hypothetical protein
MNGDLEMIVTNLHHCRYVEIIIVLSVRVPNYCDMSVEYEKNVAKSLYNVQEWIPSIY